jgi:hypothetical protein
VSENQWVIRYTQGPAAQVGPFPAKEAATEWAQTYKQKVSEIKPFVPLTWHIGLLVDPGSLEWW